MQIPVDLSVSLSSGVTVIAGSKKLPLILICSLIKQKIRFQVISLDLPNHFRLLSLGVKTHYVSILRIGQIIKIIKDFSSNNIVMIGYIARPSISWLKGMDSEAKEFLAYLKNLQGGDDRLLGRVITYLKVKYELDTLDIRPLLLDITLDSGFQNFIPSEQAMSDINLGTEFIKHNSFYDIGQAVVVRNGHIIAVEAIEGTKKMLHRVVGFKDYIKIDGKKYGGVLVKLPKAEQELRIDIPTIGIETLNASIKAGLSGIAVAAKLCYVIDKDKLIKQASKKQFLIYAE